MPLVSWARNLPKLGILLFTVFWALVNDQLVAPRSSRTAGVSHVRGMSGFFRLVHQGFVTLTWHNKNMPAL